MTIILVAMSAARAAQESAPKKAVTCATCHAGVVNSYAHAPMRHAMEAVGANPALETHPNLSVKANGYTYTVLTKNGKSTYTVSDGTNSLTLPIQWMLGQHSQTWVLEKDGHLYESLVSFYRKDQSLAITPGDERIVPHTLLEAIGRELPTWEVKNCFTCHASGYKPEEKLDRQKLTGGLNCDRCHAGAAQHQADAEHDIFTTIPAHLKRMNAGETSEFCGQCHRTWDKVVREGWHGPLNVRFQPYRLANSRCFDAGDKRIGCLVCHDPHQQENHPDTYYDAKCLACHTGNPAKASSASASSKSCPVAKEKCVSCHMPKVAVAGGHSVFTDHQIRIVRDGEPYPN